jgi:hypothetical protein
MSGPKASKRKIPHWFSKAFFFISAILVGFIVHYEICIRIYLNKFKLLCIEWNEI